MKLFKSKSLKFREFLTLRNPLRISKKGQLGPIEAKFFFFGVLGGLVLAFAFVFMANKGILIPFKLSFLCSTIPWIKSKKGQLGPIEAKFFFFGVLAGIILALAFIFMANKGILIPFKLSFICPAVPKK